MQRAEVFHELERRGAEVAHVYFSGGHDEGSVDTIILKDSEGNQIAELEEVRLEPVYDEDGQMVLEDRYLPSFGGYAKRPKYKELSEEKQRDLELFDALSEPVYERFGSFAGEFSVDGTVVWGVSNRNYDMHGHQYIEEAFEL